MDPLQCGPDAGGSLIPAMTASDIGEVIFEHVRAGATLKVSAIHVASGTEAVAVGPALEPRAVERLALGKLKRLLVAS